MRLQNCKEEESKKCRVQRTGAGAPSLWSRPRRGRQNVNQSRIEERRCLKLPVIQPNTEWRAGSRKVGTGHYSSRVQRACRDTKLRCKASCRSQPQRRHTSRGRSLLSSLPNAPKSVQRALPICRRDCKVPRKCECPKEPEPEQSHAKRLSLRTTLKNQSGSILSPLYHNCTGLTCHSSAHLSGHPVLM